MAVGSEVVDISVDPLDERRRRGRAWLRLGIPIGGVALMVGVILAIALYSERANRAGALMAGDLDVVRRMVTHEKAQVSKLREETQLRDLALFCLADEYSALREKLGLTVVVPT